MNMKKLMDIQIEIEQLKTQKKQLVNQELQRDNSAGNLNGASAQGRGGTYNEATGQRGNYNEASGQGVRTATQKPQSGVSFFYVL
jgi:hypothetical protein